MFIRYVTMGLPKGPHRGVVCDWPFKLYAAAFVNDRTLPLTASVWLVPGTMDVNA